MLKNQIQNNLEKMKEFSEIKLKSEESILQMRNRENQESLRMYY